jgi:hypothetical protein
VGLRPNPLSSVQEQADSLFFTGRRVFDNVHLNPGDQVVLADAQARAFTVVLPNANAVKNRAFLIAKVDNKPNVVTIAAGGTSLIDGALNQTLTGQYTAALVWSDGNAYWILATAFGVGSSSSGFGVGFHQEEFVGPLASITLAIVPQFIVYVSKNGVVQRPVAGPPTEGQYSHAGRVVTMTVQAGANVVVVYV